MQVSSELLRGNEKDDMAKMISVLAGYGLSYKPEAVARGDADSSYEQTRSPPHVLVPEIDQLVTSFGADEEAPRNKATSKKKPRVPTSEFHRMVADRPMPTARPPFTAHLIPNALRSTISQEIAIEKIRRQQNQLKSAEELMEEELLAEAEEYDECADGEWSAAAPTASAAAPGASSSAATEATEGSSLMDTQHSDAAAATSVAAGIVQRCMANSKAAAATADSVARAASSSDGGNVIRDFFGNVIPAAAATSQASKKKKGASGSKRAIASGASDDAENVAQKGGISSSPGKKARKMLKYKFQKGFTNAIRRPVLMSDLM